MMWPRRLSIIDLAIRCVIRKEASTLVRNMDSQSSSVMSMSGAYFKTPALLTKMSTSRAALANSPTKWTSFKSPAMVSTAPPHCFLSASSSAVRRPVAKILAPAPASATVAALPIPALAPVTSTVLPANAMLGPLPRNNLNYTLTLYMRPLDTEQRADLHARIKLQSPDAPRKLSGSGSALSDVIIAGLAAAHSSRGSGHDVVGAIVGRT